MDPVRNIIMIDIDTTRERQVIIEKGEGMKPHPVLDMWTLCEGIITILHAADKAGAEPAAKSLRKCIETLEKGFASAQTKGEIVPPKRKK